MLVGTRFSCGCINYLNGKQVFCKDVEGGEDMNFSQALEEVKNGKKISRLGWNGKGMYVFYQKGYPDGISINKNTQEAMGLPEGTVVKFRPYLSMYTAQGDCVPWVASQTDLLADDWEIVA